MRIKGIAGCFFYLLYTIAVLLLMLWLQFPAEAVRKRAETDLNRLTPGVEWRIGAAGLALPGDLRFSGIKGGGKGSKEALFSIDSFSLRPDITAWLRDGSLSAQYRLRLPEGGGVSGRLSLTEDYAALKCSGEVQALRLDSPVLKQLLKGCRRTVSGSLSASFNARQEGQKGVVAEADVTAAKGAVSLQQPVLGMEQIAFDSVHTKLEYQGGLLHIKDGKMESRLFGAEFSGTLRPEGAAPLSQLQLQGFLIPRPELMASLGNPMLADLLKRQLRQGKLPFIISGALKEPGIHFTGLPTEFSRPLQRRGKQP